MFLINFDTCRNTTKITMITSTEIKYLAKELGADLCGIASIDRFDDCPTGFHPRDVYKNTKSIISIACRIPGSSMYIDSPSPYTAIEDLVLLKVSQIALSLTLHMEKCGFHAIMIPSEPYDYWDAETMTGKGILSLKHLGYKAGLGSIGKNSLLCNDRYGNLIKLGAVITDAVLIADRIMDSNLCKDSCTRCIDSCPVGAIGLNAVVTQKKCREYAEVPNKRGVEIYACNACRKVCPNSNGIRI
jgi:epoxyqueuosine reductase